MCLFGFCRLIYCSTANLGRLGLVFLCGLRRARRYRPLGRLLSAALNRSLGRLSALNGALRRAVWRSSLHGLSHGHGTLNGRLSLTGLR